MFPCGVCQLNVTAPAVECDICDVWLHKSCASFNDAQLADIVNRSWTCYCCRTVHNDSFVYRAYNLNVSNVFDPLAGIPSDDSVFLSDVVSPTTLFQPNIASSPIINPKIKTIISSKASSNASSNLSGASNGNFQLLPSKRNSLRIASFNGNSSAI